MHMIKSAADKRTARFLTGERVKEFQAIERQAQRRVAILNEATCIEDLRNLPSNHFEALGGDRKGKYSIRINRQWRVCFIFRKGEAHEVEITDYH
jgi:toxin HigB-1